MWLAARVSRLGSIRSGSDTITTLDKSYYAKSCCNVRCLLDVRGGFCSGRQMAAPPGAAPPGFTCLITVWKNITVHDYCIDKGHLSK